LKGRLKTPKILKFNELIEKINREQKMNIGESKIDYNLENE
jgi:hypothetical protein